jgi:hypothetical protein
VIGQRAAATMAGGRVSQQPTPSTPTPAAADVSTVAMAEKLDTEHTASDIMVPDVAKELAAAKPGTTGWASEIVILDVSNEVAASAAAVAADPGTGHLAAEIVNPHAVDEPTPFTPAALTESAGADLEPNTMSMSPGMVNAHDSMVSTTTVPEVVPLPDADAQVPPDPSGAR